MFNWTTTTILNSLKDMTTGLPLIRVWGEPQSTDAEGNDFKEEPKLAGFSGKYPVLKIKRDHTFESRYVSSVYKSTGYNPTVCEMTVDVAKVIEILNDRGMLDDAPVTGRLAFYVALEGSEESIYANDWYQKGKPFSVGFSIKKGATEDDAEKVAAQIVKNANKFGVVMYGKKVFDITADGAVLTVKGTHEYQRFYMAAVAIDEGISEEVVDSFDLGVLAENENKSEEEVFELTKRGLNGFGTYHQLVKDLRLPTAHNTKWLRVKADETPIVGALYNQYIITYCAPSMANPGFTVIGQHNMSVTTHVFWVNQAIAKEFENFLEEAEINVAEVNVVEAEGETAEVTMDPVTKSVAFADADGEAIADNKVKKEGGVDYAANHNNKLVHSEAGENDKVAQD